MKFDGDSSSMPVIIIPLSMANSKDSGVLSGSGGTGEGGLSRGNGKIYRCFKTTTHICIYRHKCSSLHNAHLC